MSVDNVFYDSNIIVYALSNDNQTKRNISLAAIKKHPPIISTQVLNECANVFLRKKGFSPKDTKKMVDLLAKFSDVALISIETIHIALDVMERYHLSYYDSLIIASAIQSDCNIVYSEDMQDGLVVDDKLTIVNVFNDS